MAAKKATGVYLGLSEFGEKHSVILTAFFFSEEDEGDKTDV